MSTIQKQWEKTVQEKWRESQILKSSINLDLPDHHQSTTGNPEFYNNELMEYYEAS